MSRTEAARLLRVGKTTVGRMLGEKRLRQRSDGAARYTGDGADAVTAIER